ncbi:hypothetical protein [Buchnera aphidicola]
MDKKNKQEIEYKKQQSNNIGINLTKNVSIFSFIFFFNKKKKKYTLILQ